MVVSMGFCRDRSLFRQVRERLMSETPKSLQARSGQMFEDEDDKQRLPSHERILLIARVALRDPASLTKDEIQELATAMIMHYAQMGIG